MRIEHLIPGELPEVGLLQQPVKHFEKGHLLLQLRDWSYPRGSHREGIKVWVELGVKVFQLVQLDLEIVVKQR